MQPYIILYKTTLQLGVWKMLLLKAILSIYSRKFTQKFDKLISNKKDGYCQRNVRQFLLFGYLTRVRVTPVCHCLQPFCGCRHLATSRESKAYFGLPGYATGTIAVNVTWIERGFIACQKHRSMFVFCSLFLLYVTWTIIITCLFVTSLLSVLYFFLLMLAARVGEIKFI